MRICQSGCFRLTLIQASIRRSYPFCSLYLPMLMILFFRHELPFWGEKGKKFGLTQAFFTSFQLSASCCVRTTSASSFFTASSCFFLQCRAICLYGNPRCSIRCRLRVYGLAIWDSPIFTLPSSSCVRKSNSRPNVLMTISGFKVFSQYSSFFLYRYIRVK